MIAPHLQASRRGMTGSTHTKPRARSLISSLCIAAMLALALALAVGFGGSLHPAFDSFAHLRIHVAGLLGLAGLVAFGLGLRAAGIGAVIVAGLAVASTLASPFWHSPAAAGADIAQQDVARYRLLQLNLRFDHPEPNRVLSLIARAQPDIVTLNEVSPQWRLALERIAAAYPHRLVCAASAGVGGVAIQLAVPRPAAGIAAGARSADRPCDDPGRRAARPNRCRRGCGLRPCAGRGGFRARSAGRFRAGGNDRARGQP